MPPHEREPSDTQFFSPEERAFWQRATNTPGLKDGALLTAYETRFGCKYSPRYASEPGPAALVKYPLLVRALRLFRRQRDPRRFACMKAVNWGSYELWAHGDLTRCIRFARSHPDVGYILGPEEGAIPLPRHLWTSEELMRRAASWDEKFREYEFLPMQGSVREVVWER